MKKLFALILCLSMLGALLAACSDDSSDTSSALPAQTSSDVVQESSHVEAQSSSAPESETCWLPEKNWNTTLKWASRCTPDDPTDVRYYEIWCEEELGDTVSKVIVERSRWLEDTYGITIEMVWNPSESVVSYAKLAADTGLELDVITAPAYDIGTTLKAGYYYDINELNSSFNNGEGWLRLDQPYWDQNSMRDYSFGNRIFMLTGDICLYDDENTWAMFFNKDMVEQYGFESPYKTVEDGNWTLDTLYTYCKQVTKPDGDRLTWDATANHTWGMVTQTYDGPMFMLGCGQSMIQKDSNDLPVMRVNDQRNIDVAHKVLEMLLDQNTVGVADFYGAWNSGVYGEERAIFGNGHAMFMPSSIAYLSSPEAKDSEVNVGVIPLPKADDIQEDYSSSSNVYWLQMVAIPYSNTEKLEATLFALEAMAWYGEKYVVPEYYEKVLKLQKFRDEEAEKMLDLIFKNRSYDMGITYSWADMMGFYDTLIMSKSTDIVSLYEANREKYQSAIDEAIETFTGK